MFIKKISSTVFLAVLLPTFAIAAPTAATVESILKLLKDNKIVFSKAEGILKKARPEQLNEIQQDLQYFGGRYKGISGAERNLGKKITQARALWFAQNDMKITERTKIAAQEEREIKSFFASAKSLEKKHPEAVKDLETRFGLIEADYRAAVQKMKEALKKPQPLANRVKPEDLKEVRLLKLMNMRQAMDDFENYLHSGVQPARHRALRADLGRHSRFGHWADEFVNDDYFSVGGILGTGLAAKTLGDPSVNQNKNKSLTDSAEGASTNGANTAGQAAPAKQHSAD